MTTTEQSERATAYHEAGHVVITIQCGRAVKRVSIVEDDDSFGRVDPVPPGDWFRPDAEVDGRVRRRIEADVMALWGGTLAEERLGESTHERLRTGAQEDVQRIVNLADYVASSTDEVEAYIEWLRIRTRDLLDRWDVWAAVVAVAEALLTERTLSARRVRAVIAESFDIALRVESAARP